MDQRTGGSLNQPLIESADILSFRHMLVGALRDFLRGESLAFEDTAEALGEVMVALARLQEEGSPLYPTIFLCEDLAATLKELGGRDHLAVGFGPLDPRTLRRALKQCGPLGRSGWAIYVVRKSDRFEYGVFRTDSFYLEPTPMARLRELVDSKTRIVGVVQLGEDILELRGSSGGRRLIYLSGAPTDALPAFAMIRDVASAVIRHVPEERRVRVRTFVLRVLVDAMRSSHGTLIAVLPKGAPPESVFFDAIQLERPIRVSDLVATYLAQPSEQSREAIQGAGRILEGMLGVDGITVLASDGSVVAYNAFLHFSAVRSSGESDPLVALGGARRRTFDALSAMVGHSLLAAFVRSQDGFSQCLVAPGDSPLWNA